MHSCLRHLYLTLRAARRDSERTSLNFNSASASEAVNDIGGAYGHLKKIRLIWVVRSEAECSMFDQTLNMIGDDDIDGIFSAAVHITNPNASVFSPIGMGSAGMGGLGGRDLGSTRKSGRPDLQIELAKFQECGMNALAFVCGPSKLIETVSDITHNMQIDFRCESFEF